MTMLQPIEWDALSSVEKLLSTFAEFTNIAGGEKYITLSMVILGVAVSFGRYNQG